MKRGIMTKPRIMPVSTNKNFRQQLLTLDYRKYGIMIGEKNTRKNGRSKIPKMMNPIVLKTEVQPCLFLSSNALFSPKRVTPQLVSEKYPKWFA